MFLYSAFQHEPLQRDFSREELEDFKLGLFLSDVFPDAEQFLGGGFGYIYVTSEHGGLRIYTTLESENGSMTLEHSF